MEDSCPICYEDLEQDSSSKLINCMHEFHIECIHQWLKIRSSCPICRSPLNNTFTAKQKYSKKNYLNCSLILDPEKKLEIKYENNYKASIPFNKIKSVKVGSKFTNIVFNYYNKLDTLEFAIPNAFYFLECFRSKVVA